MNEDDTFRRLKRIPFVDIQRVHSEWLDTFDFNRPTKVDYEKYGWTETEYFQSMFLGWML